MPTQSTLTTDEKARIKNAIPAPSNKIFFAALARIYYAYPKPHKWSYAGLQGALVFTLDKSNNTYHFKMVDLDGTRGVLWDHELYENLEYNRERTFFHSFEGDKCMIGFVFADESEAKTFHKKVSSNKDSTTKSRPEKKKKHAKGGKIDKSMISAPKTDSFIHIAHMGYDSESGFTTKGVDPSWTHLLENLEGHGVSKKDIAENQEFIKKFTRQYLEAQAIEETKKLKPPRPPPPPSRPTHTINGSTSSAISPTAHATPPPPPAARAQSIAPPPPARLHARNITPITPAVSESPQTSRPPLAPPRRPVTQSNPPPPPARPLSTHSGAPPAPPRPSARPRPPPVRPTPASESVPPSPPVRSTSPPVQSTSTAPPPPPPMRPTPASESVPPPPPARFISVPPAPPPPPPLTNSVPPPPPPPL